MAHPIDNTLTQNILSISLVSQRKPQSPILAQKNALMDLLLGAVKNSKKETFQMRASIG
jgi:hypothetical protein